MAFNLGHEANDAVTRLKNNPDWRVFVVALEGQMSDFTLHALDMPPDPDERGHGRIDGTGYARALRDLVRHIGHIERPEPGNRAPKVTLGKVRESVHA